MFYPWNKWTVGLASANCGEQENNVTMNFSLPSKPTTNPLVELLNSHLREEWLKTNSFLTVADAQTKIEACQRALASVVLPQLLAR